MNALPTASSIDLCDYSVNKSERDMVIVWEAIHVLALVSLH